MIYDRLRGRFGAAAARTYGQSQLKALDWIRNQAAECEIDSDLVSSDSYVFSVAEADRDRLAREAEAAQGAGMPAAYVTELDLPFAVAGAVRFTGQAQFHPRKWLLGLTDRIEALGGQIIEGVRVTQVREGDPMVVESTAGDVSAAEVVIATHYPILDRGMYFARLEPVRDLVVCGIPARSLPWRAPTESSGRIWSATWPGPPLPRRLRISVGTRRRYAGWAPRWWRHTETGMGWSTQYQPTAPTWDAWLPSTTRNGRGTAPAIPRGSISTERC